MFVEHRVGESVGAELAKALVMIYCRHLHHGPARAALRAMALGERRLLAEFEALDALHAELPFVGAPPPTLREELELLYWHQAQRGGAETMRQLRKLCAHDRALTGAFDRLDRLESAG